MGSNYGRALYNEYELLLTEHETMKVEYKLLLKENQMLQKVIKEKEKLEGELKRVRGKLSNEGFTSKAPQVVVEAEREKLSKYENMMDKVVERLNALNSNK